MRQGYVEGQDSSRVLWRDPIGPAARADQQREPLELVAERLAVAIVPFRIALGGVAPGDHEQLARSADLPPQRVNHVHDQASLARAGGPALSEPS